ncbi:MAG: hypothetical protein MUE61_04835 [Vicinamibacterales bacterium]|nr:hypothetical protein [Vicinamibacterales bacterium]
MRVLRFVVAVALPPLLTCLLAAVWVQSGRIRLFGDEPHYVIIAESVVRDGDVELRNNHALEERSPTHVGEVAPHAYAAGHRWYPLHGPGLGVLIAPGLSVGGVLGARLTTCALSALLPLTMFLWLDGLLGRRHAMWLTLAATLSIPYVFGAVHLYPDPVAAAMAAPLLLLLAHPADGQRRYMAWAAFWLVTGLLPLLMVKFLAPSILLAMFALAGPPSHLRRLPGRHDAWRTAPLFVVGPLILAAYHIVVFGDVLGPRGMGELAAGMNQAVMVLLGLHLDQAQGIFLQQPLLLAGVPALGVMAVRRPGLAAAWCALYASLLVPNLLQIIPFGGASPSGRFAWPAAWLWLVPLAVTFSWHRGQLERFFRPVLLAAGAYQAVLALRWLPSPMTITNEFTPDLALRNSLFPVGMRAWLPSFYSADFLSFPPNVVAIVALLLLVASGPVLGWWLARSRSADRRTSAGPGPD